jgi:hypothetical protein
MDNRVRTLRRSHRSYLTLGYQILGRKLHASWNTWKVCKSLFTLFLLQILSALESKRRELMIWLCTMDVNEQQDAAFTLASPGTGKWIFDSVQFKRWIEGSGKSRLLWCPGNGEFQIVVLYLTH